MEACERQNPVVSFSANVIRVEHDAGFYSCKLAENKFPSTAVIYEELKNSTPLGSVNAAELTNSVAKAISLSTGSDFAPMKLDFGPDGLKMTADDFERQVAGRFAEKSGKFDGKRFGACLGAFKAETLALSSGKRNWLIIQAGPLNVILMPLTT